MSARMEPIAVLGMACRFPLADDVDAYWRLLREGKSAQRAPPEGRAEYLKGLTSLPGIDAAAALKAGYLEKLFDADPEGLGLPAREVAMMDPQARLLLETAWDALEDAGQSLDTLRGSQCGVAAGLAGADAAMMAFSRASSEMHAVLGGSLGLMPNRISYLYDWHGPSVVVDALCASSLWAIHQGCQWLRHGEAGPVVLAGGANALLHAGTGAFYFDAGVASLDGACRPFDASADGMVRGEGAAFVVLKRLADAQADGDRVLAVIEGSAVNHDGAKNGLTAPNRWAQGDVIRKALALAQVEPRDIALVEGHGTATLVGDALELEALGDVFGEPPRSTLWVGSAKGAVGHLESAAGVASFIKAVLELVHGEVAPSASFENANDALKASTFLRVPTSVQPLGNPTRVGVSSFGLGGANVHVVVGPAPKTPSSTRSPEAPTVLLLSAHTDAGLAGRAGALRAVLERDDVSLSALASTLAFRRTHLKSRAAAVVGSMAQARAALESLAKGDVAPGVWRADVARRWPRWVDDSLAEQGDARLAEAASRFVKGQGFDRASLFDRPAAVTLPTYPWQRRFMPLAPL